jgi:hypothetical protein
MLNNLIDLQEVQGRREDLDAATACLASLSGAIAASPVATANATRGLLRLLVRYPAALAAALPAGSPAGAPAQPGTFTPVVVFASTDRITVGKDEPVGLTLRLRIAEGYHITAADPGPDAPALVPLRVDVAGGGGIAAYADYPAGEPLGGPLGRVLVHRGEFELPVAVERTGGWTGKPILTVTFQACTDTACLQPATVELDVAIDRKD